MRLVTPLPAGFQLQEFRVERALGHGGFGTTYLAVDRQLDRQVAVKEFTPHHLVTRSTDWSLVPHAREFKRIFERALNQFLDEARKLARFRHPNIVRVNRFFTANGTGYFAMEVEEGGSLRSHLSKRTFSDSDIRSLLSAICSGLQGLHSAGLVHRDIKPDNVVLRKSGEPVLIDFGAAVTAIEVAQELRSVIFTPGYAPPEQLEDGGLVGPFTDIYAIGATSYELMFGSPPPPSDERLRHDRLVEAMQRGVGRYSTQLLAFVDTCLKLDPAARPQTLDRVDYLLQTAQDRLVKDIARDISGKMLVHFSNWANPNEGLCSDELAAFVTLFPVVDLAWRLGAGLPTRDVAQRFAEIAGSALANQYSDSLKAKGFGTKGTPAPQLQATRLDQYAAAYLLDRGEEGWTYDLLLSRVAKNCLIAPSDADMNGFTELMRDVVDRGRGRIKKAVKNEFETEAWYLNADGSWSKRVKTS